MKFCLVFLLASCAVLSSANSIENDCIQNELNVIPTGIVDNIFKCFQGVVKAVLDLGEDLVESTNAAVQNALRLKNLILECSNAGGTIRQMACIAKNVGEFKNTILQVIADAQELVEVLQDRGQALVDAVTSCHLHDSLTLFYIEAIAEQIKECPSY